jgi:hypothetical protein
MAGKIVIRPAKGKPEDNCRDLQFAGAEARSAGDGKRSADTADGSTWRSSAGAARTAAAPSHQESTIEGAESPAYEMA